MIWTAVETSGERCFSASSPNTSWRTTSATASRTMTTCSQKPARVSADLRSSTRGEAGEARTGEGGGLGGHEIRASSRSLAVRERNSSSRPPVSAGRSSSRTTPAAAAARPTDSASASTSRAPSAPGRGGQAGVRQRLVQGARVEPADDHARRGEQLGHAALGDDLPAADDDELVGHGLDLAQQVGGEQDGARPVGEVAQQPAHPRDALGIEAVGRLVEDQHARLAEQRLGDPEPLAHAERVGADALLGGGLREPDVLHQLVDAPPLDPEHLGAQGERLAAAAAGVLGGGVQQDADLAARVGQAAVARAEHRGVAGVGVREPADHAQRGGLAGAVGAEEAGHGAGLAVEGDVIDGRLAAVALGEMLDGDHGLQRRRGSRPGPSPLG